MNAVSRVQSYVCFFTVPSASPHWMSSYTAKYYSLIELCLTGILNVNNKMWEVYNNQTEKKQNVYICGAFVVEL